MKSKQTHRAKWRRELKAALVTSGLTYVDIGRKAERSPNTVSVIIALFPKKKSYRIQKAITDLLDKPYESVWGAPHKRRKDADTIEDHIKEAVNG